MHTEKDHLCIYKNSTNQVFTFVSCKGYFKKDLTYHA